MDKVIKEEIKNLKKTKDYEAIYKRFGQKVYAKEVPNKYKKQDLKKLSKEGKYMDIYNKYGKKAYENYLIEARTQELRTEKGVASATFYKMWNNLKMVARSLGFGIALSLPVVSLIGADNTKSMIEENQTKYKTIIEENDMRIADYAEEVKDMGLENHTQVIMKVMDDMWERIEGYGTPTKYDDVGVLELSLTGEDAIGVCRNFATDNAKRMNAIDQRYNARTINVYMGEDGYSYLADIDRNIVQENETVVSEESKNDENVEKTSAISELAEKSLGNHMVTLIDIPERDLTLVMDPTNPSIGVYIDGKIIMLNPKSVDNNNKYAHLDVKEWTTAVVTRGGMDGIINTIKDSINSYNHYGKSTDEVVAGLIEDFGIDAQNEALKFVRQKKQEMTVEQIGQKIANDAFENYKKQKQNDFKKRMAVKMDDSQLKDKKDETNKANEKNNNELTR